jgi:PilZ domain
VTTTPERRKFKRLNAPVLCRPMGQPLRKADPQQVQDISLGGLCVFTDDKHAVGERLELELFLPTGDTVELATEVVWIDALPEGPAKFEVGLRYVDINAEQSALLESVLKEP